MKVFITLDYELFLLDPGESVENTLLLPTQRLHDILAKHNAHAIFFVDAGYLFALNRQRHASVKLESDYQKVTSQLRYLESNGHEIGLHIHPHWEDSYFDGKAWKMKVDRYKLSDFSKEEAGNIFRKYYWVLQRELNNPVISFRAGGWCLEPFDYIRGPMLECGISIDSTVYYGGYAKTDTHDYNFRNYPHHEIWRFEEDPSREDEHGHFTEIPFSTYSLPPWLYWKVLFNTILNRYNRQSAGQGIKPTLRQVIRKLFFRTIHAVSLDSFKSAYLLKSYQEKRKKQDAYFCVIGHPKCFDENTYRDLKILMRHVIKDEGSIVTFSECMPHIKATLSIQPINV